MYPNASFQDHLTWLFFHLKDLTWSKAQTSWSCKIKSMDFGGFHWWKLWILLKTAVFLPKSTVFDENCIFWPKTVDFAVSVWFLSLKLENCWLVLSPERIQRVNIFFSHCVPIPGGSEGWAPAQKWAVPSLIPELVRGVKFQIMCFYGILPLPLPNTSTSRWQGWHCTQSNPVGCHKNMFSAN